MTSENTKIDLHHGDCLEIMRGMPDNSVDSVVTDPPYGLSFMGKAWDKGVPSCEVWKEALRVLKPGGHLLAFAGTRTQHRMACAIEDAGFEIRDMIAWVYGSGLPKSHNVGKAVNKLQGNEWAVMPNPKAKQQTASTGNIYGYYKAKTHISKGTSKWEGWGTTLKPALEPITVARKPLAKGNTVVKNVLKWGTGAINVDGCRVGMRTQNEIGWSKTGRKASENRSMSGANYDSEAKDEAGQGRWPANLIHNGSQEVLDLFPETNGGSTVRFFYCAKASKKDRDDGCEGMHERNNMRVNGPMESEEAKHATKRANHHPTVKPTDLMRYLCRLVTPPNGTVLDPFMGSGSTGKAAALEGFNFIGCELDAEYIEIAKARIGAVV